MTRISADPQVVDGTLAGPELELYRDHVCVDAHHLALTRGNNSYCTISRKFTQESLSIFAASELACVP